MDHRYNLIKIGKEIVQTPEQAIEWAKRHGLLPTERKCRRCRQPMTLRTDRGIRSFRCRRCEGPQFALTDNTWFEGVNSKIMVAKGILLTYAFATKMSYEQAIRESTIMETGQITNSTLFTDCWRGYTHLGQNGFEHWCVNHQLQFVTEEGVTTNKIESQWRPLRQRLARGGVQAEKLADHLCEFLWRRDCLRREVDPFNELISTIRNQFPGH
ncbi:hypothetical protein niasHS_016561 [Heterodera schachtii]|uniref:ISXO2-like transposase domain-containing protein n=1 Tax=Heterodera schachtii TaxID=97005 RepID=A0ABD2HZ03_HETSC